MRALFAGIFIFLVLTLTGCGGSSGGNDSDTQPSPDLLFPTIEFWGEEVKYRTFEGAARTSVTSVTQDQKGNLCYIIQEASLDDITISPSHWQTTVECRDKSGETYFHIERSGTGVFKQVMFIPGGRFIVAELIDATSEINTSGYFLRLTMYSSAGHQLQRSLLTDPPGEDELYFYTFTGTVASGNDQSINSDQTNNGVTRDFMPELSFDNIPVLFDTATVKLVWKDNALSLLAYTYGVKVYRFNDQLEQLWNHQVMPAHPWLWVSSLNNKADLSVSDDGDVFVAFEVLGDETKAYEWHFGRSLDKTSEDRDIAVSVYGVDGQYLRSFIVGNADNHESLAGMFYRDSSLWFGANVRRHKFDQPNYTTEWDLLLIETTADSGITLQYHFIDHKDEDFANVFIPLPNGNVLFGGITGFKQMDSNSLTGNGSGLLLEISASGEIQQKALLREPRHVGIESVSIAESNYVLFSGIYDAPITHTCDQNDSLCYQKSMAGKAQLN